MSSNNCTNEINIFIPEILEHILQYVDIQTLVNCRLVSSFWKEIADFVGRKYGYWENVVKQKTFNGGVCVEHKSVLNWLDLFINTRLWSNVAKANLSLRRSIATDQKVMHIYRDNLIMVQDSIVKYINVETLTHWKSIIVDREGWLNHETYYDYNETDELIMMVNLIDPENQNTLTVTLYGKEFVDHFNLANQKTLVIQNVVKYKLRHNSCIVFNARGLGWELMWDKHEFKKSFLARCYEMAKNIEEICIYDETIYILLVGSRKICKVDREAEKFEYIGNLPKHFVLMEPYLAAFNDPYTLNMLKEKAPPTTNLAFALNHGYVGIYGYHNGDVKFHVYINQKLATLDFTMLDKRIRFIEVHERKDSHYIFVLTATRLYQILIDYPPHVVDSIRGRLQHLI